MKKRFITSIFIVLATVLAIASKFLPNNIGDYIFDIFVIFICFIASSEMSNILSKQGKEPNRLFSTFYIILNYIILLICNGKINIGFVALIEICALLVYALLVCLFEFLSNIKAGFKVAFKTALYTLINCAYPTFLFGTLLLINRTGEYSSIERFAVPFIIMVFAITMLTDTFAYLIGSAFKGPKLAPKISPNKTVSGAVGGLFGGVLGAMIVVVVVRFYAGWQPILDLFKLDWWHFMLIGFVGSAVGQAGDLFESWLKRKAVIKDSGTIFPGHGGMRDRVDAMSFVAPFICLILICVLI